jgi:hypothetical protein
LLLADKSVPFQKLVHHSKDERFHGVDILFVSRRALGRVKIAYTMTKDPLLWVISHIHVFGR